mgnify:CR=1 FL=1
MNFDRDAFFYEANMKIFVSKFSSILMYFRNYKIGKNG